MGVAVRTVIKLLILCLIVGIVMAAMGLTPAQVYQSMLGGAKDLGSWSVNTLKAATQWGGSYVLMGAAIVVPIWLLTRLLKGRKKAP